MSHTLISTKIINLFLVVSLIMVTLPVPAQELCRHTLAPAHKEVRQEFACTHSVSTITNAILSAVQGEGLFNNIKAIDAYAIERNVRSRTKKIAGENNIQPLYGGIVFLPANFARSANEVRPCLYIPLWLQEKQYVLCLRPERSAPPQEKIVSTSILSARGLACDILSPEHFKSLLLSLSAESGKKPVDIIHSKGAARSLASYLGLSRQERYHLRHLLARSAYRGSYHAVVELLKPYENRYRYFLTDLHEQLERGTEIDFPRQLSLLQKGYQELNEKIISCQKAVPADSLSAWIFEVYEQQTSGIHQEALAWLTLFSVEHWPHRYIDGVYIPEFEHLYHSIKEQTEGIWNGWLAEEPAQASNPYKTRLLELRAQMMSLPPAVTPAEREIHAQASQQLAAALASALPAVFTNLEIDIHSLFEDTVFSEVFKEGLSAPGEKQELLSAAFRNNFGYDSPFIRAGARQLPALILTQRFSDFTMRRQAQNLKVFPQARRLIDREIGSDFRRVSRKHQLGYYTRILAAAAFVLGMVLVIFMCVFASPSHDTSSANTNSVAAQKVTARAQAETAVPPPDLFNPPGAVSLVSLDTAKRKEQAKRARALKKQIARLRAPTKKDQALAEQHKKLEDMTRGLAPLKPAPQTIPEPEKWHAPVTAPGVKTASSTTVTETPPEEEPVNMGTGNYSPGRLVASTNVDTAYLSFGIFSRVDPARGTPARVQSTLIQWELTVQSGRTKWVLLPARETRTRILVVPPGHVVSDIQVQQPGIQVTIEHDTNNRQWWLTTDKPPGRVKVFVRKARRHELRALGFGTLAFADDRTALKKSMPPELWAFLQKARYWEFPAKVKLVKQLLGLYYYSVNPRLDRSFQEQPEQQFLRFMTTYFAGTCDSLSLFSQVIFTLLDVPAAMQIGYSGTNGSFYEGDAHSWLLISDGRGHEQVFDPAKYTTGTDPFYEKAGVTAAHWHMGWQFIQARARNTQTRLAALLRAMELEHSADTLAQMPRSAEEENRQRYQTVTEYYNKKLLQFRQAFKSGSLNRQQAFSIVHNLYLGYNRAAADPLIFMAYGHYCFQVLDLAQQYFPGKTIGFDYQLLGIDYQMLRIILYRRLEQTAKEKGYSLAEPRKQIVYSLAKNTPYEKQSYRAILFFVVKENGRDWLAVVEHFDGSQEVIGSYGSAHGNKRYHKISTIVFSPVGDSWLAVAQHPDGTVELIGPLAHTGGVAGIRYTKVRDIYIAPNGTDWIAVADRGENGTQSEIIGTLAGGSTARNQIWYAVDKIHLADNGYDWLAVVRTSANRYQLTGTIVRGTVYQNAAFGDIDRLTFIPETKDWLAWAKTNKGWQIIGTLARHTPYENKIFKNWNDLTVSSNKKDWLGTAQLTDGSWVFVGTLVTPAFSSLNRFKTISGLRLSPNGRDWLAYVQLPDGSWTVFGTLNRHSLRNPAESFRLPSSPLEISPNGTDWITGMWQHDRSFKLIGTLVRNTPYEHKTFSRVRGLKVSPNGKDWLAWAQLPNGLWQVIGTAVMNTEYVNRTYTEIFSFTFAKNGKGWITIARCRNNSYAFIGPLVKGTEYQGREFPDMESMPERSLYTLPWAKELPDLYIPPKKSTPDYFEELVRLYSIADPNLAVEVNPQTFDIGLKIAELLAAEHPERATELTAKIFFHMPKLMPGRLIVNPGNKQQNSFDYHRFISLCSQQQNIVLPAFKKLDHTAQARLLKSFASNETLLAYGFDFIFALSPREARGLLTRLGPEWVNNAFSAYTTRMIEKHLEQAHDIPGYKKELISTRDTLKEYGYKPEDFMRLTGRQEVMLHIYLHTTTGAQGWAFDIGLMPAARAHPLKKLREVIMNNPLRIGSLDTTKNTEREQHFKEWHKLNTALSELYGPSAAGAQDLNNVWEEIWPELTRNPLLLWLLLGLLHCALGRAANRLREKDKIAGCSAAEIINDIWQENQWLDGQTAGIRPFIDTLLELRRSLNEEQAAELTEVMRYRSPEEQAVLTILLSVAVDPPEQGAKTIKKQLLTVLVPALGSAVTAFWDQPAQRQRQAFNKDLREIARALGTEITTLEEFYARTRALFEQYGTLGTGTQTSAAESNAIPEFDSFMRALRAALSAARPHVNYLERQGPNDGVRCRRKASTGSEFFDYREYAPGDDIKLLDQNILARLDLLVVRQNVQEIDLPIHFLMDFGTVMSGELSLAEWATESALALNMLFARTRARGAQPDNFRFAGIIFALPNGQCAYESLRLQNKWTLNPHKLLKLLEPMLRHYWEQAARQAEGASESVEAISFYTPRENERYRKRVNMVFRLLQRAIRTVTQNGAFKSLPLRKLRQQPVVTIGASASVQSLVYKHLPQTSYYWENQRIMPLSYRFSPRKKPSAAARGEELWQHSLNQPVNISV